MRLQGKEALLKFIDMIGGYQMKGDGWEWVGSRSLKRQLKITQRWEYIGVSEEEFIEIGAECGCDFTYADIRKENASIMLSHGYVIC
mgnify:FL=1